MKAMKKGSITVEAALILPIFLCFFLVFLYLFQILIVQEHIQSSITKTGLDLAKGAYILDDFVDVDEALDFDTDLLDSVLDQGLKNLVRASVEGSLVKELVQKYLDSELIDKSCIKDGYSGVSFKGSSVLGQDEDIDIIVSYKVEFLLDIFGIGDIAMTQRVRLRGWTGHKVAAKYFRVGESEEEDGTIVYVTETGTVYHLRNTCSHISFSVEEVNGIPNGRRNSSGAKYYPCSSCCKNKPGEGKTYYITSYGTRYHTRRDCSRIKRNVREVPLSEVKGRSLCKRCNKNYN